MTQQQREKCVKIMSCKYCPHKDVNFTTWECNYNPLRYPPREIPDVDSIPDWCPLEDYRSHTPAPAEHECFCADTCDPKNCGTSLCKCSECWNPVTSLGCDGNWQKCHDAAIARTATLAAIDPLKDLAKVRLAQGVSGLSFESMLNYISHPEKVTTAIEGVCKTSGKTLEQLKELADKRIELNALQWQQEQQPTGEQR
jgi:hypothetical protein